MDIGNDFLKMRVSPTRVSCNVTYDAVRARQYRGIVA